MESKEQEKTRDKPQRKRGCRKRQTSPQIKKAYREQYTSMMPHPRRQYFEVKLATVLAYRPQQNKRWLEGVQIAIEANTTREKFLSNKTPKLEIYYNSRRNNSVTKIEHRSPTHTRKQGIQTLVSR